MLDFFRDIKATNILANFENDPWKITDVRALPGLDRPAPRSGDDNTPEP